MPAPPAPVVPAPPEPVPPEPGPCPYRRSRWCPRRQSRSRPCRRSRRWCRRSRSRPCRRSRSCLRRRSRHLCRPRHPHGHRCHFRRLIRRPAAVWSRTPRNRAPRTRRASPTREPAAHHEPRRRPSSHDNSRSKGRRGSGRRAQGAATQDHVEAREGEAGLATEAVVAAGVDVPASKSRSLPVFIKRCDLLPRIWEQNVGGSNPLAPTELSPRGSFPTASRLVRGARPLFGGG